MKKKSKLLLPLVFLVCTVSFSSCSFMAVVFLKNDSSGKVKIILTPNSKRSENIKEFKKNNLCIVADTTRIEKFEYILNPGQVLWLGKYMNLLDEGDIDFEKIEIITSKETVGYDSNNMANFIKVFESETVQEKHFCPEVKEFFVKEEAKVYSIE